MDSLYHTHQYVGAYKLKYFIIFQHFWCFYHCFYLEKCGLRKNVKVSGCLQADILYYFSAFLVFLSLFLLRKLWPRIMLRFLIKSCFLSRSNQNHFKFGTCWCLQADIFFDFLHFLVLLSLYLLRKMWPRKSVKVF